MSTTDHRALIASFYAALGRRDAATMVASYASEATFEDPVFGRLDAQGAAAMWRMLCERGKDLRVVASGIEADARHGKAHWQATYTYGPTRRPVVNEIDAAFTFRHGLIVEHVDRFDLKRWARQALGVSGRVLGFTPLLAPLVRKQAAGALDAWRRRESDG
ncbi:MAG: nuclear transport factor 2 family protein [Betaproteobacteria bacterium]